MFTSQWGHVTINYLILMMTSVGYCLVNTTLGDIERLFNDSIINVDRRFRPMLNQSKPTVVNLSLMLLSLADVDEVQQSMSSNVQLVVSWSDELRTWDPNEYGGLTKVHPEPKDIWRPRLFLSNSITERDMFKDDYAPLTIYNTGHAEWLPGGIMYSSCSMKMTYFPYDTQICTLTFTTGESSNTILLRAESPKVVLGHYDKNGEWQIVTSEAISLTIFGKSKVKFTLTLNRLASFTLLNIVIPVNIISSLSALVFIMPVQSGERVSFSITVLLSLTVYTSEISADLPTSSESMPLLIMYLTSLLLHSGFAILANLIVLIRHYHFSETGAQRDDQHRTSDGSYAFCSNSRNDLDMAGDIPQGFSTYNSEKAQFSCHINLNNDDRAAISRPRSRNPPLVRKHKVGTGHGGCLQKFGFTRHFAKDNNENDIKIGFLKSAVSRILQYIRLVDVILFVLFFSVWLVITIVFMTLISFGLV